MSTLGFLLLARDAGVRLFDLARDIAGLARPGDEVVLVDDGSQDDTAAWIGRAMMHLPWTAGVRLERIVTGARGAGDLGIAANLALDAATAERIILLPGEARPDRAALEEARRQAEAGDLDLLRGPAGGLSVAGMILRRRLLEEPRLRCDEGRAAHGDLRLVAGATARAQRLDRAAASLAALPAAEGAGPALVAAAEALLAETPGLRDWLAAELPALLDGMTPGARAAAGEALPRLRQALGLPEARRAPAAPLVGDAPLRIACEGPHARRLPFAYPALRPLWEDRIALADPASADMILWAHPLDVAAMRPEAEAETGQKPLVLFSEEPFWDTIFSPDPLAPRIRLQGQHRHGLRLHQVNHHRSPVFDFDALPYFLLTDHRFAPAFAARFARNAALTPQDWALAFAARPVRTTFMAERRTEAFHDVAFPEGEVLGLCAWRTRLAEACTKGVERLGASWQGGRTRFDLAHWHLDKLVRLDGRTEMLSGVENTHQPTYLSEKIFDAFACGARPLYMAGPGHRLHGLDLPEGSWINLWGLDSTQAARVVDEADCDAAFFAAYAEAQRRLARRFDDPAVWVAERARLRRTLLAEMARLADLGPA